MHLSNTSVHHMPTTSVYSTSKKFGKDVVFVCGTYRYTRNTRGTTRTTQPNLPNGIGRVEYRCRCLVFGNKKSLGLHIINETKVSVLYPLVFVAYTPTILDVHIGTLRLSVGNVPASRPVVLKSV